jgi:predicted transcriptional regulator
MRFAVPAERAVFSDREIEEYRVRWNLRSDHPVTATGLFAAPIGNGERARIRSPSLSG